MVITLMVCTLSKAQVNKLIKTHGKQLSGTITNEKLVYIVLPNLSGTITKEKLVYIVLPNDVNELVDVQDILGNSLGKITVKEAWAL